MNSLFVSAVQRGGNWNNGRNAGVFSANLNNAPSNSNGNIGFRCPPEHQTYCLVVEQQRCCECEDLSNLRVEKAKACKEGELRPTFSFSKRRFEHREMRLFPAQDLRAKISQLLRQRQVPMT